MESIAQSQSRDFKPSLNSCGTHGEQRLGPYDWRNLVGHRETMTDLKQVLDGGRMHPIVLLEGFSGIGKRHLAMWMGARFLCSAKDKNIDIHPCGICSDCRTVLQHQHHDVMIIDNGIDSIKTNDILALQEHLDMLSSSGLRIGIIMNADRMTPEAANRLLKTLEEPAAQAKIILTSSRPLALPSTVLGRCLRWRLKIPAKDEVLKWMRSTFSCSDHSAFKYESVETMAQRLGYSPGEIYRELGANVDEIMDIKALVVKLLNSDKPNQILQAASDIARVRKLKVPELLAHIEWSLTEQYRRNNLSGRMDHHSSSQNIVKVHLRRSMLKSLRRMAVGGRVALNTQLVAESVGLARWGENSR